jgi:hypothetical protein
MSSPISGDSTEKKLIGPGAGSKRLTENELSWSPVWAAALALSSHAVIPTKIL